MAELSKTELQILIKAYQSLALVHNVTQAAESISESEGFGRIRGRKWIWEKKDRVRVRDYLIGYCGIENPDTFVPNFKELTRIQTAKRIPEEKYAGRKPRGGRALLRSINGIVCINGEQSKLIADSCLEVPVCNIKTIEHDCILVIENFEAFTALRQLNIKDFPYVNPLLVYRGDTINFPDACKKIIEDSDLPVIAFTDFDPQGFNIALSMPDCSGAVFPFDLNGLNRGDLFVNQRLQSALKDLMHAHSGNALKFDALAGTYFSKEAQPQEIIGITVVRSQSGRVNNSDPSFVLTAFRQVIGSGQSEARFAFEKDNALKKTEWEPMHEALASIASATPCWLSNESDERNRRATNANRYQDFVRTILDDCTARKSNAVVFIDSSNSGGLWSWLTDQNINPSKIEMESFQHLQEKWKGLRIVRTRQQMAPLMVEDKAKFEHERENGPVLSKMLTTSSPTGLYKVGASGSGPLAYWSIEGTGAQVKRGSSCYRETRNAKTKPGQTKGWLPMVLNAPHINQWPTPNALEYVIALAHESDQPDNLASFCHKLRHQVLHYDDKTALPVPLFFEKVVRQYVARFAIEKADQEEAIIETDQM